MKFRWFDEMPYLVMPDFETSWSVETQYLSSVETPYIQRYEDEGINSRSNRFWNFKDKEYLHWWTIICACD